MLIAATLIAASLLGPTVPAYVQDGYNAPTVAYDDFGSLIDAAPECHEDEVIVLVIWDPYGPLDDNNTVGCVPADNLPVTGYRP